MATSKVIPLIPRTQAQAIPKPPQEITQGDLSFILATRLEIDRLKANLAEAEDSVKSRLEAGAEVERGTHLATLKEQWRKSTSWRDVAERLANRVYGPGQGDSYCQRVLASTKAMRSV